MAGFVIRSEAAYTLNFMIYLQNIYLNQKRGQDQLKFPYFPSFSVPFREDFEADFNKLWSEFLHRIAADPLKEMKIYVEEKTTFYERLFMGNKESLAAFEEVTTSFDSWWGSVSGRFSVEHAMDEQMRILYSEMEKRLEDRIFEPSQDLNLSLIYDELCLGQNEWIPYFAVVDSKQLLMERDGLLDQLDAQCI